MYQHKTSKQLLYDDLRDITWRLNLLNTHIGIYDNCNPEEVAAARSDLLDAQELIFAGVYKRLRDAWGDNLK